MPAHLPSMAATLKLPFPGRGSGRQSGFPLCGDEKVRRVDEPVLSTHGIPQTGLRFPSMVSGGVRTCRCTSRRATSAGISIPSSTTMESDTETMIMLLQVGCARQSAAVGGDGVSARVYNPTTKSELRYALTALLKSPAVLPRSTSARVPRQSHYACILKPYSQHLDS